jgi:hypothetical protein
MLGTFTPSVSGSETWWCQYHDPNRPMRLGQNWMEERRILAEEAGVGVEPSKVEAELQRRIAQHPGWKRQEGEGRDEYARRMMALNKDMIRSAVRPMPR